ncbi:MAG: thiamine-phosphate kinase [Planctomycetaceae bacterium]|nr:thiamine-phosphate kinase [Planctomycetaceae bacterium]MCA9043629.1 thiamine-phosphate kinase [Planctomycetaceae bacterium]
MTSRVGELEFVDWISRQAADANQILEVGIGDDAAVQRVTPGQHVVVAKDVLMEGAHFEFESASPELAGRKALAVNLSDIAAMGARPVSAYIGLVLPKSRGIEFARRVDAGIRELANQYNVCIAGGDTNTWDGPLVISVTVLGEVAPNSAIQRSGARLGDILFVSGPLGGSLSSGRHLTFEPRLELAQRLTSACKVNAMMDISDGLALDCTRMLKASGVGAVLDSNSIPIHSDVSSSLPAEQRLQHALHDGEDFELLIALSEDQAELFAGTQLSVPLQRIGRVTAEPGLYLQQNSGEPVLLKPRGYEHQFK